MDRSLTLDAIRTRATTLFVWIVWAHVALAAAVAAMARNPIAPPVLFAAGVAVVATLAARLLRDGLTLRAIVAVCMTFGPIVFVYAARGHASGIAGDGDWQIDYHMYFFAVFAMLAAYVDWRPIAISAALTAVHHLLLDLVTPASVFPQEGLDRVALHAFCVVAECGVLFWMTAAIAGLFKRVEDANELVEFTARETAEQLLRLQTAQA